jgi:hypothetical protein
VTAIVGALRADSVLGRAIGDAIPQGSWAHQTIIKPVGNNEFDADVLLTIAEQSALTWPPRNYNLAVAEAFGRSGVYRDRTEPKDRCVRVHYANDCHVDVVPFVCLSDGHEVIVNKTANAFELTNPAAFSGWLAERDAVSQGHLRRVIRLLKYLRDHKKTFKAKSVILTTVVAGQVSLDDPPGLYADIPTALTTIVCRLDAWLQANPLLPLVVDPSCPGTTFNHRWNQASYTDFRMWVHGLAAKASAAHSEPDARRAVLLWQDVFGTEFTGTALTVARSALARLAGPRQPTRRRDPGEEFIDEKFPVDRRHAMTLGCTVHHAGWRPGVLRDSGSRVPKGCTLIFEVRSSGIPGPYVLYWKVKNTGTEAGRANDLRGTIVEDDGTRRKTETTRYRGRHYVEAYAVQGSTVVASARHEVIVT